MDNREVYPNLEVLNNEYGMTYSIHEALQDHGFAHLVELTSNLSPKRSRIMKNEFMKPIYMDNA